jgi:hypothetical protein
MSMEEANRVFEEFEDEENREAERGKKEARADICVFRLFTEFK